MRRFSGFTSCAGRNAPRRWLENGLRAMYECAWSADMTDLGGPTADACRPTRAPTNCCERANRREFLQQAGGGLARWRFRGFWRRTRRGLLTDCRARRRPGRRIFRPGPRASSTCSCTAVRAISRRLIPSPICSGWPVSRCRPSFGPVATRRKVAHNPLLATKRTFRKCGQSGIEISDFLPHIAECADHLAVIRSCWADSVNHPQAVYEMNTGSILMGKPSLGSWVSYGLGTENQDLPAFVVLPDPAGGIKGGPPAYGAGFLPASHQGTVMRGGDRPILDLRRARGDFAASPARRARPDRPAQRPSSRSSAGRTPSSRPASKRTSWRFGCRRRRPRPSISRRSPPRRGGSTGSTSREPPSSAPAACWHAGWSSAESGSFSSTRATSTAGTRTTTSRPTTRSMCGRTDKPVAGLLERPETARAARATRW